MKRNLTLIVFSVVILFSATEALAQKEGQTLVNSYVNSGVTYHLFWNSKTGNSQLYKWNSKESKYTPLKISLPEKPLGNVKGEVMINSYVNAGITHHLFWDNKTGKSQLYKWNSKASKYIAAKIGLPEKPLDDIKGTVMINSYIKVEKSHHLFWDSKTGSSRLYKWNSKESKYTYAKIGLPDQPLKE